MKSLLAVSASCALVACGLPNAVDSTNHSPSTKLGTQSADTSCEVVLRTASVTLDSTTQAPATTCPSGNDCSLTVTGTFDVAMSQALSGAQALLLYQGGDDQTWYTASAEPIFGAQIGFLRYQFTVTPAASASGPQVVQLIPFIQTTAGDQLYDHNRVADPNGSYQLDQSDNWAIADDGTTCQGAAPQGTETLSFAANWSNNASGSLVPSGKLDISYDVYRLSQVTSCSQDSVPAFGAMAFVEFQPDGTTLEEAINGPFNYGTDQVTSLPLEFDVPADATSVAVWFEGTSDCGPVEWDSNYSQNYDYVVTSAANCVAYGQACSATGAGCCQGNPYQNVCFQGSCAEACPGCL